MDTTVCVIFQGIELIRRERGTKEEREREKRDEPFLNFQLFSPLWQFFKTIEGVG